MKVERFGENFEVFATDIQTYDRTGDVYVLFYIYDKEHGWQWVDSKTCKATTD